MRASSAGNYLMLLVGAPSRKGSCGRGGGAGEGQRGRGLGGGARGVGGHGG